MLHIHHRSVTLAIWSAGNASGVFFILLFTLGKYHQITMCQERENNMVTIADVKRANPLWFSKENRRFFGDVDYRVLRDRSEQAYLVRGTYGWTDMFGEPKRLRYRLNPVTEEGNILSLMNGEFKSLGDVKEWLRGV